MFTVKFGTGNTIEATGINESYRRNGVDELGRVFLNIEATNPDYDVEYYKDILMGYGALDSIKVMLDDKLVLSASDYTLIDDISIRLLATGERFLNITLTKE